MSFDLCVVATVIPDNIQEVWIRKLRFAGLFCEFHPSFDIRTWKSGFCPVSVRVLNSKFPALARCGPETWIVGFELEITEIDTPRRETLKSDPEFMETIENASYEFHLGTNAGRNVLDLTLQYHAAATLANITKGLFIDPQTGQTLSPQLASRNTSRIVEAFARSTGDPESWQLKPFPGWNHVTEATENPSFRSLVANIDRMPLEEASGGLAMRYFSGNLNGVGNHPILYAHGEGVDVVGPGCFKTFHPTRIEDAIAEYRRLLVKCGYG